jgi:hypothetical protein
MGYTSMFRLHSWYTTYLNKLCEGHPAGCPTGGAEIFPTENRVIGTYIPKGGGINAEDENGHQISLPSPEDILQKSLPNGITVLARSNFNSPSVSMGGYLPPVHSSKATINWGLPILSHLL